MHDSLMANINTRANNERRRPLALVAALAVLIFAVQFVVSTKLAFDLNKLPDELEESEESDESLTLMEELRSRMGTTIKTPLVEPRVSEIETITTTTTTTTQGTQDVDKIPANVGVQSLVGKLVSRLSSQLPDYFDFDKFRRNFKRNYTSSEFLFRKATFLGRCMELFKWRVAARLGRSPYKLALNKFADRSPNEIKRMFAAAPPIELRSKCQRELQFGQHEEKLRRINDERAGWDLELESQSAAIGDETTLVRDNFVHESEVKARIEQMMYENADLTMRKAIADELRGVPDEGESQSFLLNSPNIIATTNKPLPWPGKQKSPKKGDPESSPMEDGSACSSFGRDYRAPKLKKTDQLDWSEHECFHTIYDQEDGCGKCYVFTATTLAEFYSCSERENEISKRKFSKNYVLHCGQKYSHANVGCLGGSILDTLRFIAEGGIYTMSGWKKRRRELLACQRGSCAGAFASDLDLKCPFNRLQTPFSEWGSERVEMNPQVVHTNNWKEALEDGPIAVSVQMPAKNIELYAGDVHDGADCAKTGLWHAMILVGYGVDERGVSYWRFRNSFGPDWGDKGHFNMAMEVSGECLAGGVRIYREPLAMRS